MACASATVASAVGHYGSVEDGSFRKSGHGCLCTSFQLSQRGEATAQPCRDHEESSDEEGELSCTCSTATLAPVCHHGHTALLPVPPQLDTTSMVEQLWLTCGMAGRSSRAFFCWPAHTCATWQPLGSCQSPMTSMYAPHPALLHLRLSLLPRSPALTG